MSEKAAKLVLGAFSVGIVLYSLVIAQEILLGVLAAGSVWVVYLCYRFVVVLGRIATALEQLVEQQAENADDAETLF